MKLNPLSADMERCNGNGEYCCDTCASKLQIQLDGGDRLFPHTAAMATNGRCFLKLEAAKGWTTK